jgi:hypothetical protein
LTEYIFICGTEVACIKVEQGEVYIKDKITNFQYLKLNEKLYRDREKRNKFRLMRMKLPKLTQDETDVYIVMEMAKLGYKLKAKM